MKNIVVLYYNDDWDRTTPMRSKATRESFEDWYARAEKYGMKFYRASVQWYDNKKGVFTRSWTYEDKKWKKITTPIKPHGIFDKIKGARNYELLNWKLHLAKKTTLFNHPLFRIATDNKLSQYLLLGEFMPASYLATSRKEIEMACADIKTEKIVIKPLHGSGGFGIIIEEKSKILRHRFTYPLLVQAFVKSTRGIPGFSKKNEVADLRLTYINQTLIYALSRVAKESSLFTNFHQGAHALLVPQDKIPKNVHIIAKKISQKFSVFPATNFSLDFMFTDEGNPLLIEMNTTPGFDLLNIVGDDVIKENNLREFLKVFNDETSLL